MDGDQIDPTNEALAAPLTLLPRPVARLGDVPRVKSIEDAELAFREIAWAIAVSGAIKAVAEKLISAINEAAEQVASIRGDDEEAVSLSDRKAALEAELLKWGDANRPTLCPGKKKSRDFRNGRLRWRDAKDTVERNPDVSAKAAKSKIGHLMVSVADLRIDDTAEQLPLAVCLQRAVDAVDYHGAIVVALDVNKSAAAAAHKLLQITDDQLAEIEHQFKAGEEYVSAECIEFVRDGAN